MKMLSAFSIGHAVPALADMHFDYTVSFTLSGATLAGGSMRQKMYRLHTKKLPFPPVVLAAAAKSTVHQHCSTAHWHLQGYIMPSFAAWHLLKMSVYCQTVYLHGACTHA
jgi:hypothetical protein